jgi:hypothetical protein
MKAKTEPHTPGPWRIWEPERHQSTPDKAAQIIIGKPRGDAEQEIACVNADGFYVDHEERETVPSQFGPCTAPAQAMADARLIAAAPDLAEALRALVDCFVAGRAKLYRKGIERKTQEARAALREAGLEVN